MWIITTIIITSAIAIRIWILLQDYSYLTMISSRTITTTTLWAFSNSSNSCSNSSKRTSNSSNSSRIHNHCFIYNSNSSNSSSSFISSTSTMMKLNTWMKREVMVRRNSIDTYIRTHMIQRGIIIIGTIMHWQRGITTWSIILTAAITMGRMTMTTMKTTKDIPTTWIVILVTRLNGQVDLRAKRNTSSAVTGIFSRISGTSSENSCHFTIISRRRHSAC